MNGFNEDDWVAPSNASVACRHLHGYRHDNKKIMDDLRVERPFAIRPKGERRDLVRFGDFLEFAKRYHELLIAQAVMHVATNGVDANVVAQLRRELAETRKRAEDADIERQAALAECKTLRAMVSSLSHTLRALDLTGYGKNRDTQGDTEGKTHDAG